MISYKNALEILNEQAKSFLIKTELVKIKNCVGRILSENLYAQEMNPAFDNAAMDGFAFNFDEVSKNKIQISDQEFYKIQVQDLLGAGDKNFSRILQFGTVEIMTGAALPNSYFDTVIKVEDVQVLTEDNKKFIKISQLPQKGSNVRKAGEDISIGQIIIERATRLEHHHLILLATFGFDSVPVYEKINIAITSTGKELVSPSEKILSPSQIRNSTGLYLHSYLEAHDCVVQNYGIIEDQVESYKNLLIDAFNKGVRVFISTGAVSAGVFDFVKPALLQLGAKIEFHKCAIRPGKPILFATLEYQKFKRYIFGVPGNVISTAVGCRFFIVPFLESALKLKKQNKLTVKLLNDTKKPEGLTCFFKAKLTEVNGEQYIETLPQQASSMISPLKDMNAWLILPEAGEFIKKDTIVEVERL